MSRRGRSDAARPASSPLRHVARHVSSATPTRRVLRLAFACVVTDRTDRKLAHLDGLNLSRAWMLVGIARGLPASDSRLAALRATARPTGGWPTSGDRRALRRRPLAGHVRRVPRDHREPSLALSTRCRAHVAQEGPVALPVDCQTGNYFLPDDDKAMLYVYRIE